MADAMHGILADAKQNKYSIIKNSLSEDDIAAVWGNVSSFIEKQMGQQKGVNIQGLGIFTFSQKKLDIGNNKFILIQRPVFNISEKLAQNQGLQYVKHHVPGQIPVVQLNYAAMSFESPFDRDVVENCVREILGAVQRAIGAKKNVELTFNGIGKLSIRDSKVKMKFFKEFINQMDGSGKLVDSLQNRPGTVDSVMSDRSIIRPASSNTVILPKISNSHINGTGGLAPVTEQDEEGHIGQNSVPQELDPAPQDTAPVNTYIPQDEVLFPGPGVTTQEGMEGLENDDALTAAAIRNIEMEGDPPELGQAGPMDTLKALNNMDIEPRPASFLPELVDDNPKKSPVPASRTNSRMAAPMAMATGVSLLDDLVPSAQTPKSAPSISQYQRATPVEGTTGMEKPVPPAQLAPLHRSLSFDQMKPGDKVLTPPGTACGHPNAGQELCYLCHQRARRNVPVSFQEERKRREEEEDRLLQQYQYMKDAENVMADQEMLLAKRHNLQKMAAFNLGVSEAQHQKKRERETEFHKSYIFQKRPLTPPRFFKQNEYSSDLSKQVEAKDSMKTKVKSDEDFLERLEQVQLAEDLAIQREQYLRDKADEREKYKSALESQIQQSLTLQMAMSDEALYNKPKRSRFPWMPSKHVLRPFSDPSPARLNEDWKPFFGRLRFKPLELPPREPDNEVFGKNDMTNEKMAERRRRAYEMFRDQQDLVAQRKREAILKRLAEQKEEEQVLDQTKREMLEDRANRFTRRMNARKRLEDDWKRASTVKQDRMVEERIRALSPGVLLHEQCDKYSRCGQCKRVLKNSGESNLWCESRYIPGSRLMI